MTLITSLKNAASELSGNLSVKDVRIGLSYTAVQLEDERTGLAYTFRDSLSGGCSPFTTYRPLAGQAANELLELFESKHPIATALALATANALFNTTGQDYLRGPALDHLILNPDDQVGMVGNFTPLVKDILPRVGKLYIFERQPRPQENILGIAEAEQILPHCQVALITATAIINHSIDRLLALTEGCREVIILGSSTPLAADVFRQTPVTRLAGMLVESPAQILSIVSESGGTPAFKQAAAKVNLLLRRT